MALWIASDYGEHNNKFRILEEPELLKVQNNMQDWNKDVEKMSLWSDKLPSTHFYSGKNAIVDKFNNSTICVCPQVSTLVVQFSQFYGSLGWKLFKFGPCLRVLDLSTRVFLESTISSDELKGIAGLINLEFLNLSRLPILELPEECKRLSKLKYLLMDEMKLLKECPTEVIVGLEELIVFRMDNGPMYRENFMRGLENLQKLQETSINLTSIDLMNIFLNSEKLQKCARFMQLKNMDMNVLTLCHKNMKNLESLFVFYSELKTLECNPTSMVFNNLHNVKINFCGFLEDLDFLSCAPSLEYLFVANCRSLQRILCIMNNHIEKCKDVVPVISTLKQLVLINLPNLEIICNTPLTFPSLEIIRIQNCPKLQQNPFDDMVATNTNLREIIVQKKWWNSLKWKDDQRNQRDFLQYIH